ncbi:pilus assembly protein TadG-related protein [Sphingopyxis bauzanensis]|nr:pilus assembly protein TadG-related protein [Sphingopyxis bauzanensis]GGJ41633.1 hypothetical protein GCM10011393_09700 [Sphingopyxis bauzanensis]
MRSGNDRRRLTPTAKRMIFDQRGATAAIFAISLPVLVGMGALAVDVGIWNVQKRQAQGAADQAAYSAAVSSKAGNDLANVTSDARAITASMGFSHDPVNGVAVAVSNPPTAGQFAGDAGYWEVTVTEPQATWLAGYLFGGTATVNARAVAGGASGGNACIIGLNTTESDTVRVWGSGVIDSPGCNVFSNSNSSQALVCGGSCTIRASTYAVGDHRVQGSGDLLGAVNATGRSPVVDPYADVTVSPPGSCTTANNSPANNFNLTPNYYCALNISNTVNLSPGVYYANTLSVSGTLNAPSGVTIILLSTGNNVFSTNGSPVINITAPATGAYAGIAIMSLTSSSSVMTFNGNTTFRTTGALYFPNRAMKFLGSFDNTKCTQLVANKIEITGNANMHHNCPGAGIRSPGGSTVALME